MHCKHIHTHVPDCTLCVSNVLTERIWVLKALNTIILFL